MLSTAAVLYAHGYYWGKDGRLIVTGSLHLKNNTGGRVFIDGTDSGELSFFGNYSLGQLAPNTYVVEIKKDGFQSWSKKIDIKAGQYIDFPRVILQPEIPRIEIVATSSFSVVASVGFVDGQNVAFSISPKGQKEFIDLFTGSIKPVPGVSPKSQMIVSENTPANKTVENPAKFIFPARAILSPDKSQMAWIEPNNSITIGWVDNSDHQPFNQAGTRIQIQTPAKAEFLHWFKDSSHLIFYSRGSIYLLEVDERGGTNIHRIGEVHLPLFYHIGQNEIFYFEGRRLAKIVLE